MITMFDNLNEWREAVKKAGLLAVHASGDVEDPYDHYYAVDRNNEKYGYFGDGNGQDADGGFLGETSRDYNQEMGY